MMGDVSVGLSDFKVEMMNREDRKWKSKRWRWRFGGEVGT